MALKYINEAQLEDKKVIARFDFNVPLSKEDKTQITDTTRVDLALETIKYILDQGASKLILMSHLGRPKGEAKPEFSLEPVAAYLSEKLGQDVVLTESCTDAGIKSYLGFNEGKVILLQNLRFHPEETANDHEFAKKLASYADIYVNDAFGTAHRKHASTYEINAFFKNKAYGGFLIQKEIEALNKVVEKPATPFVGIVGGAKVSDKIKIIERLLVSVDKLLIGGAMAYPFLKSQGVEVGTSLCADEDLKLAKQIMNLPNSSKIVLPVDHLASEEFGGKPTTITEKNIPENMMGLDIGPETLSLYKSHLATAKTVLWNGPMGLFENDDYNKGTFGVAESLATLTDAFTLVGGGDSVAAVKKANLGDKISHVSTGGGASLEYIENGTLPGIQALKFGI
ncbi:MAG: phosphoglycerate kinase [Oligoflexia bacterium]|nr:phosphoglycerate kinase [Oligoflexia bacterium]